MAAVLLDVLPVLHVGLSLTERARAVWRFGRC